MLNAKRNNRLSRLALSLAIASCCISGTNSFGQQIIKDNDTDNLNQVSSWVGGVVPGATNTAVWDSTVTGANNVLLGGDLSLGGIRVTNPGGAVTIGAGNTLTLGSGGIDMSAATTSLTISSGLTLSGGQTWNVATGQTLTAGAFTRSGVGTTLVVDRSVNTGTITASPTLTNGVVPWAIIRNSGTAANNAVGGYSFATVSGGNLVAFTGATATTTSYPANSATANYDWSTNGTPAQVGSSRAANTIRYTGSGVTQLVNSTQTQTFNALMNAGSGAVNFGGNSASNIMNFQSSTGEFILAAMTSDISLSSSGRIINNGATAGALTILGESNRTVSLAGANTYTGSTRINGGTLRIDGSGNINSTSGITVDGVTSKYLHTSTTASTRTVTLTRGTVDGTGTIGAVTVADNAANIVANGNLTGSGTLTVSSLAFGGDATMNLRLGAGVGVNVTGALSTTPANGTVTVNADKTGWVLGSNNLVSFGSFTGNVANFTKGTITGLGARQNAGDLGIAANNLTLNVTGDLPVWTGLSSSAWTTANTGDIAGPNNWATKAGQTATNFWASDTPEFNDTYNLGAGNVDVATRAVDIQGANVLPGIVTFNNSNGDYTLSSTGGFGIAGAASLVKSGTSALIVTNTNTYTGTTTINAGTLQLGNGTTNGSIGAGAITNNGTLAYNLAADQTAANLISGTGSVTKTGIGVLTLSATNTFSGDLVINDGTLTAGTGQGGAPAASNLGALQSATNRNITINNGGTLSLTGGNVLGTGASTNTLSNTTLVVNQGGIFRSGLETPGAGWWNKIGATNLNGGTIRIGSGANNTNFQGLALIGTVTVGGTTASSIENFLGSDIATNGVHLGQNAAAGQSIVFDVADVTNSSASDLNVSTRLLNTSANLTASGLTKTGAGTMTLSAISGYTGATVINGGTLQIGDGTTDGSIATSSGITNNANLGFNVSGSYTYNNAVTGTGNLVKSGTGSVSLAGANNLTGTTTLDVGALSVRGTLGSVTIADGTANTFGNATNATLNTSSLSFGGDATLNLSLNAAPAIAVSGALSTTPANGTVVINAANTVWANGNNSLISFGSFTGSVSDFSVGNITGLTVRQTAGSLTNTGSTIALNVVGDLPVWTGLSSSAWTTASTGDNTGSNNWATKTANSGTNFWAGDTPEFNDTYNIGAGNVAVATRTIDIQGADVTPGAVIFNNSAGDYTLSTTTGNGITGNASLIKSGTSALNITNNNTYTGLTSINAGTVNLSGGLAGTAITVGNGGILNVTSTGVISGVSSLTSNGSVVIAGTNTYTGATEIGVGGTIQVGDGTTDGSIATTSSITNNGSLIYNTAGTQTIANAVTGSGTIVKNGAGTLTLTAATPGTTGGTNVNAGRLIANSGFLNAGAINIAQNATLTFTGNNAVSTSTVTGSGAILNDTANTIIFTGNHTGFAGTFTHSSGTNNTQFNTSTSGSAGAAYSISAGELIFAGTGDYTVQFGSLASSAGTIRGANAAAGTTTLQVGSLNTDTTIAGNLNNGNAKLIALTKVGTGSLSIGGTNSYSGATNVNSGILNINGSTTSTVATFNINAGGKLGGSGTIGGAVTVNNGGTLAPGNSIESLGVGSATFVTGSTFAYELDTTAALTGDLLFTAGALNVAAGSNLTFTDLAAATGTVNVGDKLTLIGYSTWDGGVFNFNANPLLDDSTFSFASTQWIINYNDTVAGPNFLADLPGGATSFVTITAVPEPSTIILCGLGLAGYATRRLRKSRKAKAK